MKRLLSVLLLVVFVACLMGCGEDKPVDKAKKDVKDTAKDVKDTAKDVKDTAKDVK